MRGEKRQRGMCSSPLSSYSGVLDHEKYINSVLGLYYCNILCLQNSADACTVILCEYKLKGGKNKLEAAREKKLYGVIQSAAWKIIKCGLSV